MRVPQVNERVKEAPAHALRAMFASIGQLLLFTDRLRTKTADETTTTKEPTVPAQGAAPETEQPKDVTTPAAAPAETSTPEASTPEAAAPEAEVAPEAEAKAEAAPEAAAPEAEAEPKAEAEAEAEAKAEATPEAEAVTAAADAALAEAKAEADSKAEATEAADTAALPLANYDELTIPSLRARLRNLSIPQLNQLVGYEQAHANRGEVIAMFERRIAKLAES